MSTQTHAARVPEWTMGDRLRKAREQAGYTQKEIAEVLGIARNSVGNYELGETQPRALVLREWARLTGVPMEWIAFGSVDAPGPGGGGSVLFRAPGVQKPPGLRSIRSHLALTA